MKGDSGRTRRRSRILGFLLALAVAAAAAPGSLAEEAAGAADWKAEANARIEQIRKRDVTLIVVDRLGVPMQGAQVEADQLRHHFAFGTAINMNAVRRPEYADYLVAHFEWAVLENESKWYMNEMNRDIVTFRDADLLVDFCEDHGLLLRGHCIFWAKEQYTPPWSRTLPPEELRDEVDERLDDAVTHFRDRFLHWDVNNEMLDGHFFENRLGPSIRPHMFIRAGEIDPQALLFTNDYSILAGSTARTAAYIEQIRGLREAGAPVHAVGVQGHFWGDTVSPTQILSRLDQLSVLDLPVWVTEYDAVDPDASRRADKLENLYRSAFSHPSVEGILMWGFWAGSHWRGPDAAIVNEDWTVNAAGERYESLLAEWTTHAAGSTGSEGSFGFRGYHGRYLVDVSLGSSAPAPTEIEVLPGEGEASFMIPLKPGSCFPAGEVEGLVIARVPGSLASAISWAPLPWRPDMEIVYDLVRSPDPASFDDALCLESDSPFTSGLDAEEPFPGEAYFYLVRGEFGCPKGGGSLGRRSDGGERVAPTCP